MGAVRAVHHVAAGAARRDAITNHLFAHRDALRAAGVRSEIFAGAIDPALAGEVHDASRYPARADASDIAILHYSIDSHAFQLAADHAERCVMHYHNITPAHFLWRHAPTIAVECAAGRLRLPAYAERVVASCADSAFNARELEEAGYRSAVATGILRAPWRPATARPPARRPGPTRLLFVGRGIPNKAQHDLILALGALAETNHPAELRFVGSWDAAPAYRAECEQLAVDVGVGDDVTFLGSVDDDALEAAYLDADIFVCVSDHEGFCVPLLEAMECELPIVAFDAAAVGETVAGAGLLLDDKHPSMVAEAVIEVATNPSLRASFAEGRAERLAALGAPAVRERLSSFLAGVPS
ncbi:MAG: glycosyltransferase family 4 protein [Actinobacteria bacterium]|nr:glycosyltransferase family 4 protein [Actinomycetota bacterium]